MSIAVNDNQPAPADDAQAVNGLIQHLCLSELSVAKIRSAQRVLGVGFCDAVLRLGFGTQDDIDAARRKHCGLAHRLMQRAAPSSRLNLVRDPCSTHSEALRALRTELLLRPNSSGLADFVTVLSPGSGEGRSCLAAELAILFAQLGKPTLLVDASLRKPAQHTLFGIDNQRGLSDALSGASNPGVHAVQGLPGLSLLTAGPSSPNPLELLSDGRFEKMANEWQQTYSYIIVDTPPVDQYSDALAVARVTGRVLIVNRAEHTRQERIRSMLRRLSVAQSQILGAVITRF